MGDAARLRKGLFDERLSVKPADWVDGVLSYRPRRSDEWADIVWLWWNFPCFRHKFSVSRRGRCPP